MDKTDSIRNIDKFFTPQSIAVVGASTSPDKLGYAVLKNLVEGGYIKTGSVYPINTKADTSLPIRNPA